MSKVGTWRAYVKLGKHIILSLREELSYMARTVQNQKTLPKLKLCVTLYLFLPIQVTLFNRYEYKIWRSWQLLFCTYEIRYSTSQK